VNVKSWCLILHSKFHFFIKKKRAIDVTITGDKVSIQSLFIIKISVWLLLKCRRTLLLYIRNDLYAIKVNC